METVKKWYASKTIWTNILIALSAAFAPGVSEWIAENPTTFTLIWAGINAVLRRVTKDGMQVT